jgi:TP901-1 family phage major tail protein
MVAQKGREVLLKIGDGATTEVFTTIGGLNTTGLTINNEQVDITNKGSGGWRELLEGAGVQSMGISGSGVFVDDAGYAALHAASLANTIGNFELFFPDWGTYKGLFAIGNLQPVDSDEKSAATYTVSLESSKAITFTAA